MTQINITEARTMATQRKLYKIISGEGEVGTVEYKMLTELGLKRVLTRERCGGDRWAKAEEVI